MTRQHQSTQGVLATTFCSYDSPSWIASIAAWPGKLQDATLGHTPRQACGRRLDPGQDRRGSDLLRLGVSGSTFGATMHETTYPALTQAISHQLASLRRTQEARWPIRAMAKGAMPLAR